MNTYLLTLLIFIPLISGLILLAVPERYAHHVKSIALAIGLLSFALNCWIWFLIPSEAGLQLVEKSPWIPFLGIDYHLGIDGISLFLALLSTGFTVLAMLYAWQSIQTKSGRFYALLLLLEAGLLGTVLAQNLFLFYIFWELMLLPMFFLIGIWGGPNRIRAVVKFVIYTMAGSLILLLSILYLGVQYQSYTGQWSFDLTVLTQLPLPNSPIVHLLFFGFSLAFLIKIPIFPLHTWLPDTYTEAPPVVTFLLSGVMAKMGIYGLIRISMPLFPQVHQQWAPVLSTLAVIGIIYSAILALGQTDIKRLLAYSSISHLGLIALGVFSWNTTSLEGVVYHMINHAVATGALFLMVGLLEQRYKTTNIAELGGIAIKAPVYATAFLLLTFASIGVPGLNGFVGEFLILLGVSSYSTLLTILAALTLILSAAYMLWLAQRFLFGPENLPHHEAFQISGLQLAAIIPLCILSIVMGLYTAPFTRHISPAVREIISSHQVPVQAHIHQGNPLNHG